MILSYANKFTFIHCPKTGGSSVTTYFSRFLGPNDIAIGAWADVVRAGGRPNWRFYRDVFGPSRLVSTIVRLIRSDTGTIEALSDSQKKLYRPHLGPKPVHAKAKDIRNLDSQAWDSHFKFCFVRNPFERIASSYHWTSIDPRRTKKITFAEFVDQLDRRKTDIIPCTWEMYAIDDVVSVDFVGRYETLQTDMEEICSRIGIPFDGDAFPHAKKNQSYKYREAYTPAERKIVERFSRPELDYFGYEF